MLYCILQLLVLIHKATSADLRTRPMLKIANMQNAKMYRNSPEPMHVRLKQTHKPLCGPIPFPGISCEEITTYKPHMPGRKGPDVVVLHKPPPASYGKLNSPGEQKFRQFLNGYAYVTTSTMAAFYGGTTPEDQKPPEIALCGGIAKCSIHEWRRWVLDKKLRRT